MSDGFTTFFSAITGGLIAGAASYVATSKIFQEQRFDAAATKFRATVISELKGVYPVPTGLDLAEPINLKKSLPIIVAAEAEFKIFVKNKKAFEKAAFKYEVLCWNPPEPNRRQHELEATVESLLSFAERESLVVNLQIKKARLFRDIKKIKKIFS